MELYDSNNDDFDVTPDGKKKKKQSSQENSWGDSAESQRQAEEKARQNLFDLLTSQEANKGQEIFYPDQKAENNSVELADDSNLEDELHDNIPTVENPTDGSVHIAESLPTPQPQRSEWLNDFYTDQPPDNRFSNKNTYQEPEPEKPVAGYNREQDGYYRGYVPGVPPEDKPPISPAETPIFNGNSTSNEKNGLAYVQPTIENVNKPAYQESKNQENDSYVAERRGLRHGVVAGFLTGYVLKAYLDGRRRKREAKEINKEKAIQQDQLNSLRAENLQLQKQDNEHEQYIKQFEAENRRREESIKQKLAEQSKVMPAPEIKPPVVYAPESSQPTPAAKAEILDAGNPSEEAAKKQAENQQMVDAARRELEKAMEEPDSKRIEQDAWLRHEIDARGQEVQGQQRGQEYTHERAQELLQRQPQQQQPSHKAAGQPVFGGAQQSMPYPASTYQQPSLASGQTPMNHRLPSNNTYDHYQSSKKSKPFVAALTSPWTFLMLSIILLAYFIATLL